MKNIKFSKGFTLVELLVVIAIIAGLMAAFVPSLLNAPSRGRDTNRLSSVQDLVNFLTPESLVRTLPASGCLDPTDATAGSISVFIDDNVANFGGVFPVDPVDDLVTTGASQECTGQYGYYNFATGQDYNFAVYARVENSENGNILCSNLSATSGDVQAALVDTDVAVDYENTDASEATCYVTLVQ